MPWTHISYQERCVKQTNKAQKTETNMFLLRHERAVGVCGARDRCTVGTVLYNPICLCGHMCPRNIELVACMSVYSEPCRLRKGVGNECESEKHNGGV